MVIVNGCFGARLPFWRYIMRDKGFRMLLCDCEISHEVEHCRHR